MKRILYILAFLPFIASAQKVEPVVRAVVSSSLFVQPPEIIQDTIVYYVDEDGGNNANSGLDSLDAWQSIGFTDSNHVSNSPVIIALDNSDTWASTLAISIRNGGTAENPVIIDGNRWGGGTGAIIQASGDHAAGNLSMVNIFGCAYVTIQNITFDGNDMYTFGLVIGGEAGFNYCPGSVQNNEHHIIVQDCIFQDCGDAGDPYAMCVLVRTWNNNIHDITIRRNIISGATNHTLACYPGKTGDGATKAKMYDFYLGYNTITKAGLKNDGIAAGILINNKDSAFVIEHNTITTGTGGHGPGIAVAANETDLGWFPQDITIRYNDIRVTENWGIYFDYGQAQEVLTYGNLIYNSFSDPAHTEGGILIAASADPAWTGATLEFYFNSIVTLGGAGYKDDTDIAGICTLKNNIIKNNNAAEYGAPCVDINTDGSTIHSNNALWRSNTNYVFVYIGTDYKDEAATIVWEPTVVTADPLLTDEAGFNWHLKTGSPAIGAGVAIAGITEDIEGNPMQNYIGAYQTIQDP